MREDGTPHGFEMKRIILASASPRRREILEKTGLRFTIDPCDYEEVFDEDMSPRRLARYLSQEKARCVAAKYRDALVIAADTFVVFKGRMLGKPHTGKEAIRMLTLLNGRPHLVITGFTIMDTGSGRALSRSVETKVYLDTLTPDEVRAYVKTKEPLDKAGAYAIQGLGAAIIRRIDGDYYNVMGLPLNALRKALKEFGIHTLSTSMTP